MWFKIKNSSLDDREKALLFRKINRSEKEKELTNQRGRTIVSINPDNSTNDGNKLNIVGSSKGFKDKFWILKLIVYKNLFFLLFFLKKCLKHLYLLPPPK